ncbi:MAG: zinc ribbon domain-containing protein [Candidatus Riflebacteria bacterium]|nr:zinc ribbon domain-containing protein [Candidatus Riflebacteria bacterium]
MNLPSKKDLTTKTILFYVCVFLLGLLALRVVMKLLPPAIFLFLMLAPPIFVLADAQERRLNRPVLWAIFTLFTNVFGLVVYLLVRPDVLIVNACKSCGGTLEDKFSNCPWCGEKVERPLVKCPGCSDEVKPGWKYCPNCNFALNQANPSSAPDDKAEKAA